MIASRRALLAITIAVAAVGHSPSAARSAPEPPAGVKVEGGDVWHADNLFGVEWHADHEGRPASFIIRYADGSPIPGYDVTNAPEPYYGGIRLPPVPGTYIFEIWFYDPASKEPPPVSYLALHFDDARPQPATVAAPTWIAAGRAFDARVGAPAAAPPVSGIQGYAVSVDGTPTGSPCARVDRCGSDEIDLRGAGAASIALAALPEGVSYVHAVAVSGSGMASKSVATARVGVDGTPPTVELEGLPSGWASGPVRLTAVARDPLSGMGTDAGGDALTALAVDGEPPRTEPGATASTTVAGEGVHRVSFYGRDAVGNLGDGSLPFSHPGTATVRIDETGPNVRFATGDTDDPERIEALVADPLSGPDPDRGRIELRPAGGSGRFVQLPTTFSRGHLVARWSSDDFAHGDYEFRATGYDAAGNATTSTAGPGGTPLVLHDPVKREARLAFGFGAGQLVLQRCARADGSRRCHRAVIRPYAKRPAARTLPCCHAAVVGGRLLDVEGAPLAGQTVEVVEALARGAHNANRRTALVTDAEGRFSTRLAPGPSRSVTAEFPGTRRLTRASGRSLRLRVRAAVGLHVSTADARVGGPPVVFSGRIAHPEARVPAAGLAVQLEFRLPGTAWAQFRTVQSDAAGRFRYPYEFTDDDSAGVRFQFRALVAATGNWPFAPATSRPVTVTG